MKKEDFIVILDNGHGKNTPGKRSVDGSLQEWAWARVVTERLEKKLKDNGYNAVRIVTGEYDVPLQERCNLANQYVKKFGASNSCFISVHVNAAGNGTKWLNANGWSAYTTPGLTKADSIATKLYESAKKHLPGKRMRIDTTDGDSDIEANFYVLKHTNCPAVLTENLFMDNEQECKFLLSEEGITAIVNLHYDGIVDYINSL